MLVWSGFVFFILILLALDLGVFNRKAHIVSVKEALGWSTLWISLGLAFSVFVYFGYEYHWFGLDVHCHRRHRQWRRRWSAGTGPG